MRDILDTRLLLSSSLILNASSKQSLVARMVTPYRIMRGLSKMAPEIMLILVPNEGRFS